MKPYAKVDSSQIPFIAITFTGEKSTDENFQKYLQDLENCYDDRNKLFMLFDASQAVIPKMAHQKKQALWISQHWKLIQTYCVGTAYIIPNLVLRSVLKMIFSFQNQPSPYKIFSGRIEAEKWIKQIGREETAVTS